MAEVSPNSSPLLPPVSSPNRLPPPSLFLGPPSTNASNISLPPTSTQTRAPLLRSRSTRAGDPSSVSSGNTAGTAAAGLGRNVRAGGQPAQTDGDRTDALWAEMQATLAEVEISALSSTHVFGAAHSAALEELREAQIALAVAWGRGEADEDEDGKGDGHLEGEGKRAREGVDSSKIGTEKGVGGGDDDGDDEADIKEARRRREANERFFKRVGEGVVDVVGKLDGVAQAMAKVEKESREIWRSRDSVDSGSVAS